jgi:hypothetical protein
LIGSCEGYKSPEDIGADVKIILKRILRKYGGGRGLD